MFNSMRMVRLYKQALCQPDKAFQPIVFTSLGGSETVVAWADGRPSGDRGQRAGS